MGEEEGARAHLPRPHRGPGGRDGLRRLLREFSLDAKKGLGQHFLVSDRVVSSILARVEGAKGVLEVGPGVGALTAPLTLQTACVVAIELDARMAPVLAATAPAARVLLQDALKSDIAGQLASLPEPRCVVSNMPYNITGPLLAKFAECRHLYRNAVLMMQREVGEKIVAKAGDSDRGALSVAMQTQFEIVKVCDAKASAFEPPPKVDSVVLEFTPKHGPRNDERMISIVHIGFKQPRKTLLNNLAMEFGKARAASVLELHGLEANVRPHQLTNEEWRQVAEAL